MFKLLVAAATIGLALAKKDPSAFDVAIDEVPVKRCNRDKDIQLIGDTQVDVGKCVGFCKNIANPYEPSDVLLRICKPKHTVMKPVRIKKIHRCDCVNQELLETDEDFDKKLTWGRDYDIFVDQDWHRCHRVPKYEEFGTDANGSPVVVDVGECTGQCPVVSQDKFLELNLTLTGDDVVERVYIDGIDQTSSLINDNTWTHGDTVVQTVPRDPGTEHVIAVQVRDTHYAMQGFIATVQYDGAIQHLTGNGDWIATHDTPAPISGKQWFEPGYDSSSFSLPTQCTVLEANIWGTFWPAAFLADGASWIWGPDSQCSVSNTVHREAWFLLKFTIPSPPQANCKATEMSYEDIEVEVVKTCDCQCWDKKECEAPLIWNDYKCQCECGIDASSCPVGTIFNAEKCTCENCGICDAKSEEECLKLQCLYTFYPFTQYDGKIGYCVWRDFNKDGTKECGCPQNQCQRTQSSSTEAKCKNTDRDGGDLCEFNPNQLPGNQCDCADCMA